jgi:two-component system, NtrC family, sensor kinase
MTGFPDGQRMNLTLRSRLLLSFAGVVVFVGFFSAVLGVRLIHQSLPQVQDVAEVDLSAVREIYRQGVAQIADVVRLTARQQFLRQQLGKADIEGLISPLEAIADTQHLDILTLTDTQGNVLLRVRNPGEKGSASGISALARRIAATGAEISAPTVFSGEELAREGEELAKRARIPSVSNSYARAEVQDDPSAGLLIITGVPVRASNGSIAGVLCGGQLVNRQTAVVDRARSTLYRNEKYDGRDVAVLSVFLDDKRVATSATDFSGERAIGTLAAQDVYDRVVLKGERWIDRSYVINDWYLTAYEPIRDLNGKVIGILGLGLLERKFNEAEHRAITIFLSLTIVALLLALGISYGLLNSILKPVQALMAATEKVAAGASLHDVKLLRSPPEIEALVNAFNRMQAAIRERRRQTQEKLMRSDRLAMIGQLAAGVAHEINNPLGSILLFSRLIMQQVPPDGRVRENLDRIEKETKRCHSIVQSLLDFSRQREPKVEPVDVNRLLDATLKLFENQYLFHNIEVVKNYSDRLKPIEADQSQLQQVFMNIILNAADAMKGKGLLTLETGESAEEGFVEVSVTDTGCGIPPENITRIFDPFFTTKGVGHGTGLGLSVSYGIVQRHNGDISVSSAPGVGTTFTLTLPKLRGAA